MQGPEFVEEVRQHEELFDKSNPNYKDFTKIDEIWRKISQKFNCDAKKKWRYLRDRYVKEKRKVQNSQIGTNNEYQPDWKLYPLLEFLDDSIRPRNIRYKGKYEKDTCSKKEIIDDPLLELIDDSVKPKKNKRNKTRNKKYSCIKKQIIEEDPTWSPTEEMLPCSTPYSTAYDPLPSTSIAESDHISYTKRRKQNNGDIKTFIVDVIKDLQKRITRNQDDEDDLYLRIIKIKMTKMSEDDKSIFKNEMIELAELYEKGDLN